MQKVDISQWRNIKRSLSTLPKLSQHKKSPLDVSITSNMGHSRSHLESYAIYDVRYTKKKKRERKERAKSLHSET